MSLRVRCPQCRTILRVPAGARPKCPQCGFAGKSGPGQATHVEQVMWATGQESQAVEAVPDAWTPEGGGAAWQDPGASWQDAPAPGGETWAPAQGGESWDEPQQAWASEGEAGAGEGATSEPGWEPTPEPKRRERGFFGRKK